MWSKIKLFLGEESFEIFRKDLQSWEPFARLCFEGRGP